MLVHFWETRDTATGVRVPIVGRLRFRATLARVITGTPDEEVLPAPFTVPLDADGKASVTLPATGPSWAWEVSLLVAGGPGWGPVYVMVPEGVECDWPDLVRVDPATLAPAESAVPAWEAVVEVVQGHEEAAALAASQAAGSAQSAASSAATASAAQAATEAVNITVGTVTTGTPETPADAAISGDAPNFTLDLTIPEGDKGDPGPPNALTIGTVTTGAPGPA